MIFVGLSDDSFVIPEFEYAVFVYDFSVLSRDLIFVNDCEFSNLLFHYLTHGYCNLRYYCFRGLV